MKVVEIIGLPWVADSRFYIYYPWTPKPRKMKVLGSHGNRLQNNVYLERGHLPVLNHVISITQALNNVRNCEF